MDTFLTPSGQHVNPETFMGAYCIQNVETYTQVYIYPVKIWWFFTQLLWQMKIMTTATATMIVLTLNYFPTQLISCIQCWPDRYVSLLILILRDNKPSCLYVQKESISKTFIGTNTKFDELFNAFTCKTLIRLSQHLLANTMNEFHRWIRAGLSVVPPVMCGGH